MNGTHNFDLSVSHGDLKKSVTLILIINRFFRYVTFVLSGRVFCHRSVLVALAALSPGARLGPSPPLYPGLSLYFACCGRRRHTLHNCLTRIRHVRLLFKCHLVTEYIMTITNHVRRIQELSDLVIEYVDDREYAKAHTVIDAIEKRARLAHEHIDDLQDLVSPSLVPAER